jgi:hypothetical protein
MDTVLPLENPICLILCLLFNTVHPGKITMEFYPGSHLMIILNY